MVLQELSKVLANDYRGPKAGVTEPQVLKALLVIGDAGSIGRGKLGSTLSIGQGEVRTLIRRLKDRGLITIASEGCALTESGKKQYKSVAKVIPWGSPVKGTSLGLGRMCYALIVRGRSAKVKKGIEQRDAAVRFDALGALTVFFRKGRFRVPLAAEDCESKGPSEPWIAIRAAKPKDGDTVIVSGANELLDAEYGALAAALTIV